MTQERYVNLVFQGGGVKGITYAGVLDAMPENCKIHAVGGTSAGAIVAALLAIGVRGPQLKGILENLTIAELLDKNEVARVNRLQEAWLNVQRLWKNEISKMGIRSAWRLGRFVKKHNDILEDLKMVWSEYGLHKTDSVRQWLDNTLEGKTFSQIDVDDLKIVAADISGRKYIVYTKEGHRDRPIAEAVHASICIPIFFKPFINGPLHLVDGGILSNFPSFLFAQEKYPTIGFRLEDVQLHGPINSSWNYLKGLLQTMAEAHDKHRVLPPNFKSYIVPIPPDISATKFNLEKKDIEELYKYGSMFGKTVDWERYSSPTPVISFYDKNPHKTLEFSLSQAFRLWQKYTDRELWVQKLTDDVVFTVYIERDWSVRYDRTNVMQVEGEKSIFMSRMISKADYDELGYQSFSDIDYICEEVSELGTQDLIRIPALNGEKEKGFITFYIPPIAAGQGPRKFHAAYRVPKEFEKTVARGESDELIYTMTQRALEHLLKLRIRIFVDMELPQVDFVPEFSGALTQMGVEEDQRTRRVYRVYECAKHEVPVVASVSHKIRINLARQ